MQNNRKEIRGGAGAADNHAQMLELELVYLGFESLQALCNDG